MIFQPVIPELGIAFVGFVLLGSVIYQIINNRKDRRIVFAWLRRLVIGLLVLTTLLRPGIGEFKEVEVLNNQYDIYFVVDTTASMVAEDWGDNNDTRLSAVKSDIGRIVDEYAGSRYGLITFDSEGLLRTPITRNASALMTSVNILQPEITRYSTGSNLGAANEVLERVLAQSVSVDADRARIVFMFTDGEQTSEEEISSYSNIQPYINGGQVFGYGTVEGGRMLKQNGYVIVTNESSPYILDESVSPPVEALSKLDEANLDLISLQLGVDYLIRDASTPLQLPELEDVILDSSVSQMNVITDITWLFSSILFILLAFESAYLILVYRKFFGVGKKNLQSGMEKQYAK